MHVLAMIPDSLTRPMGGMGVQLAGLLAGSQAAGLEVRFLIVGSDGERAEGANYLYVPHLLHPLVTVQGMHAREFVGFAQATYVDTALWLAQQEHPIALVHAFDWSSAYAGMIVARRLGVPLVVTFQLSYAAMLLDTRGEVHSTDASVANIALAIETAMCHEAATIIQVSESYREFWSLFAPEAAERMVVIPNGVEPAVEHGSRLDAYGQGFNLLYLGRCCVQKGSHLLLDALESDGWPADVRLHWAGDERGGSPDLWQRVQALAATGKLNPLGYLDGAAKWAALAHADAVVMPSIHEPFGIVALEAMAAGVPLITTAVNGLGEFCHARNSILIRPSSTGIVEGVREIVGLENRARASLVMQAQETAARYSWPVIAQELGRVYERVAR